ncbi:hypothetical protein A3715_02010 [Oleiphilus sp. HI0009]|nr:hypothetical protein A3715_02010 [Oleiphilus sp. HI0009]
MFSSGDLEQAKTNYPEASSRDLKGKLLLPGFIDPHSHFGMMISAIGQANVAPPPAGTVTNFSDIIVALENYRDAFGIKLSEWIFAWGYDETQLAEGKHITKIELDKAFPNNPVYLQHVSGHMGVANSVALAQGGIDENTRDPIGGRIICFDDGKTPTGLVQEISMYYFAGKAIEEFQGKKAELFPKAQEHYLSFGVTRAQDGMTDLLSMAFFRSLAAEEKLDFDLVTLHGYASLKNDDLEFKTYKNGLKVQGIKLIGDGSPQGKTAYFTQPYLTSVFGCEKDCVGFPHGPQDELNRLIGLAYEKGIQIFVHGNGDAAIDMVIRAHDEESKRLGQPLDADRRPVVVHSQFVREDQLNKYRDYGMLPSFFTNHAFFWGDVHRENLEDERAFFLEPHS